MRIRAQIEDWSWQALNVKASAGGLSRTTVQPPRSTPPPVPDTPQMARQRAEYSYHYQNMVSRPNHHDTGYEQRHSGRGVSFAFMSQDQPRWGGSVHPQQNTMHPDPRDHPDPWHSSGVPAGPQMPHPAERLPPPSLTQRLVRDARDPHNFPQPEIVDMRAVGGPLATPPDAGGRPYVEWPGAGRDVGPRGWFW